MDQIDACYARMHLLRLLDRAARAESLTITRHGKPVARLVPMAGDLERAQEAADRILARPRRLKPMALADLILPIT